MTFVHDDRDFADLLRQAASDRRLSVGLIEKDYWVTHALWAAVIHWTSPGPIRPWCPAESRCSTSP